MGDNYVGEIKLFSFPSDFVPSGWARCDGQSMTIAQNQALNALLGTQFGGDGRTNFNLPDLRGRAIVGRYVGGSNPKNVQTRYTQGIAGIAGAEGVALSSATVPSHSHVVYGSSDPGESMAPQNGLSAVPAGGVKCYVSASGAPLVALDPSSVSVAGSTTAHNNMQPYLVLNFCIATSGFFPPRN